MRKWIWVMGFFVVLGVAAQEAEAKLYKKNQISVGIGLPLCAFGASGDFAGGSCISNDFLWFNIPVMYRRRISPHFAAGGGIMVNIVNAEGFTGAGGELMGGIRVYALPDFLFFDVNIMLGFPMIFALVPAIGTSIPLGKSFALAFKAEAPIMFLGGVFGFFQPVVKAEIRF